MFFVIQFGLFFWALLLFCFSSFFLFCGWCMQWWWWYGVFCFCASFFWSDLLFYTRILILGLSTSIFEPLGSRCSCFLMMLEQQWQRFLIHHRQVLIHTFFFQSKKTCYIWCSFFPNVCNKSVIAVCFQVVRTIIELKSLFFYCLVSSFLSRVFLFKRFHDSSDLKTKPFFSAFCTNSINIL